MNNLILLCRRHHRRVHEEGYQLCMDKSGQVVFFSPRGNALLGVAERATLGQDPVARLMRRNRRRGVAPDPWRGAPKWKRDRDIPWPIEAAARDALDPGDEEGVVQSAEEQPAAAVASG